MRSMPSAATRMIVANPRVFHRIAAASDPMANDRQFFGESLHNGGARYPIPSR